jgi:hypothetical protein
MTNQRRIRDTDAGQQMYAIVESVRTPQLLWNRLSTGQRRRIRWASPCDRIESQGPLDRQPHHEFRPTGEEARARTSG